MTKRLGLMLGLLTLPCSGSEIVAWKVPLSRLDGITLDTAGVIRCKAVPGALPFFKAGCVFIRPGRRRWSNLCSYLVLRTLMRGRS